MSRETPASSNEKPPLVEQPIKLIPRTGSGNINLTARSSRGMPSAVSSGQASSSNKTYPSSTDRRSMAIATKRSFFDVEVKPTLAELASPQVSGGIRNDSTTRINTLPSTVPNLFFLHISVFYYQIVNPSVQSLNLTVNRNWRFNCWRFGWVGHITFSLQIIQQEN